MTSATWDLPALEELRLRASVLKAHEGIAETHETVNSCEDKDKTRHVPISDQERHIYLFFLSDFSWS